MILRLEKRNRERFTVFDNRIVQDLEAGVLTADAFALLVYLLAKPDDWEVRVGYLAKTLRFSRERLRCALRCLEAAGYAKWMPIKAGKRGLAGSTWLVSEYPLNEQRESPSVTECDGRCEGQESPSVTKCDVRCDGTVSEKDSAETAFPVSGKAPKWEAVEQRGTDFVTVTSCDRPMGGHSQTRVFAKSDAGSQARLLNTDLLKTEKKRLNTERSIRSKSRETDVSRLPQAAHVGPGYGVTEEERRFNSPDVDLEEPPTPSQRNGRYAKKPVSEWNAGDLLAYLIDEVRARGKEIVTPRAAMGKHLKLLLEKAAAIWGQERAAWAVKDLIDACVDKPRMLGTGFLLHEAERYWSGRYTGSYQPPLEEVGL